MTAQDGDLRVWWIPQLGVEQAFYVSVESLDQGLWLQDVLADYDEFQFRNKVKPDYTNIGGMEVFESGKWCEVDE